MKKPLEGACFDCGRRYGDEYGFPDLMVPNDVWVRISPRRSEGGLLCPSCICRRVHVLGLSDVPVRFMSGPFVNAPTNDDGTDQSGPRCVAFGTTTGSQCILENDHAGLHVLEDEK